MLKKIKGNNIHIIIIILLLTITTLFSFVFYTYYFKDIVYSPKEVLNMNKGDSDVLDIAQDDIIEQDIYVDADVINSMAIRFATYERVNNGIISIKINGDNGKEYYKDNINLNLIRDSQHYQIIFDKPIDDMKGRKLSLQIKVKYNSVDDKVAVYLSDNSIGKVKINGKVMDNKTIDLIAYNGHYHNLKIIYIIVSIFVILGIILLYYMIFIRKFKLELVSFVSVLLIGIVYIGVFTPFSRPDEPVHIDTSYRYSNVLMLKDYKLDDGRMLIRSDDYDTLKDGKLSVQLKKNVYSYVADNMFKLSDKNELIPVNGGDVSAPFWIYAPQAIGITVGRILNFGTIPMLYLGEFFNLLSFAIILYFAIKRSPICKTSFAVIALFPMTIHLVASYSSDALVLGLTFLFVSECLYLKNKETYINRNDFIRLTIYSFLLAPCKAIAYFPICFLCFIIPKKLFRNNKKRILFHVVVIVSGLLSFILNSFAKVLSVATEVGVERNFYDIGFIFRNPEKFFNIILNTLNSYSDFQFINIFGNSLSWFNINVNLWIIVIFAVLFFISSIRQEDEQLEISGINKAWISIICLGTITAIYIGMFIGWTPQTSNTIEGVQGRYFLPCMILISILLRTSSIVAKRNSANKIIFTTHILQIFTIMSIVRNNM